MKLIKLLVILLLNVIILSETIKFGPLTMEYNEDKKAIEFSLAGKESKTRDHYANYILEFKSSDYLRPTENENKIIVALHINTEEEWTFNITLAELSDLPDIISNLWGKLFYFKVKFYSLLIRHDTILYEGKVILGVKGTIITIDKQNSNLKFEYEEEVPQPQQTMLSLEPNTEKVKRVIIYRCIDKGCTKEKKLLKKLLGFDFRKIN
jgi:hypothetical protein